MLDIIERRDFVVNASLVFHASDRKRGNTRLQNRLMKRLLRCKKLRDDVDVRVDYTLLAQEILQTQSKWQPT